MKENILDVLLYLFEHLLADDDGDSARDPGSLRAGPIVAGLTDAGFSPGEIGKAFDWLDTLARQRPALAAARTGGPVRVFADAELERLDADCRGLLMFLEQHGVLDAGQRELVLDRAIALEQDEIDVEDLKWVVLMVLFNQPGSEAAYAWMEAQMAEGDPQPLH